MVRIYGLILFIDTIWIYKWKYMIQNILFVNDTILYTSIYKYNTRVLHVHEQPF